MKLSERFAQQMVETNERTAALAQRSLAMVTATERRLCEEDARRLEQLDEVFAMMRGDA